MSKIPHCCPPWESGPCLSPSVADHPKRPAKHHWLGQPLPDQLPNTTQAHQTALLSFLQDLARTVRQIPTRYAPVRHFVLNYSDSSKRRPLGQSRSARPVVLKQGETDHPKRPAKHHWLGQPLPDQLPNTTQAHQTALLSFLQDLARTVRQIPTRYAPVRHFVLNYSDSSKRRPLGQSRSARPVVLKQGETTLARSLFSFCPAPRKQRSTCMC